MKNRSYVKCEFHLKHNLTYPVQLFFISCEQTAEIGSKHFYHTIRQQLLTTEYNSAVVMDSDDYGMQLHSELKLSYIINITCIRHLLPIEHNFLLTLTTTQHKANNKNLLIYWNYWLTDKHLNNDILQWLQFFTFLLVCVTFKHKSVVHHHIRPDINITIVLTGRLVLACFAKSTVEWQARKHEHSSSPLQCRQRMSEDQHWTKDRKELASCCDNAASQRPEIRHRQEDEILQINPS